MTPGRHRCNWRANPPRPGSYQSTTATRTLCDKVERLQSGVPSVRNPVASGAVMAGLRVTQLDHVTVIITDLERSRRFYSEVLGLREVSPPYTFDFVVLWFALGENQYVHLLQSRNRTRSARGTSPC